MGEVVWGEGGEWGVGLCFVGWLGLVGWDRLESLGRGCDDSMHERA